MKIFLFLGSRRGHAVLKRLVAAKASICGILCLVEDPHEEAFHPRVSAIAREAAIPLFYSTDVKPSGYSALLQSLEPDIAFVIGWRYLIAESACRIPAKGILVLHDSLLPEYRGFAPMNWAIINGEKQTGVTLFHIAEGIDSGPIVDQRAIPISLHDTAKTVDEKIIALYEAIIVDNLPGLADGSLKAVAQDESRASYTCKRTPEDGEIDWYKPAIQIYNLIRGLSRPFPGAYTKLNGRKVTVWHAALPGQQLRYAGNVPGRIIGKRNGAIEVLTGEGVLHLLSLQFHEEEEKSGMDVPVSVKDTFGR
jgi:methionyl-tRNA formyltransferase